MNVSQSSISSAQKRPAQKRITWKAAVGAMPGIAAALLPKVTCPACWPAYAGFLGSVGLGFLLKTQYLLPLTSFFLSLSLFALAFRAPRRRGYRPFFLGLIATPVVLIGKFYFESDPAMFTGLALFVSASLWNSWPRASAKSGCTACVESPPHAAA